MPKFITVTGFKGGVAKSTVAFHLAEFLSDKGKTLLIDKDPNRTCLSWAGRGQLAFTVADDREALRIVAGFDYVVFDTPARPDSDDLKSYAKGADLLILPCTPDIVSLEPMLAVAREIGKANYRALIVIVPPAPAPDGPLLKATLPAAGVPPFETMIRRTLLYPRAALAGCSVRELADSRAKEVWADIESLGREVLKLI